MICTICGGSTFLDNPVLWPELIRQWNLSPEEVDYLDRQQGRTCQTCGAGWRSIGLADALLKEFHFAGLLQDFVVSPAARELRVLEINLAGHLTPWLRKMSGHQLVEYPDVDIQKMPFEAGLFDVVIHSDTLEHVPNPLQGLSECARVLKSGGRCFYTVPIVVNRLTRSRAGMEASYHGNASNPADYLVFTEFGADAWIWPIQAGFESCKFHQWDFPAVNVLVAQKSSTPQVTPHAADSTLTPAYAKAKRPAPSFTDLTTLERHRYQMAANLAKDRDVLCLSGNSLSGPLLLATSARQTYFIPDVPCTSATTIQDRSGLVFLNSTGDTIPLPEKSVDLIVCFNRLEMCDNPELQVREFRRVLRPDGVALISTGNASLPGQAADHSRQKTHTFTVDSLLQLLQQHFTAVTWGVQHPIHGSIVIPGPSGGQQSDFKLIQRDLEEAAQTDLQTGAVELLFLAGSAGALPPFPWGCYSQREAEDRYHLKQALQELEEMKASTSWKITAPVRWGKNLLSSLFGTHRGQSQT